MHQYTMANERQNQYDFMSSVQMCAGMEERKGKAGKREGMRFEEDPQHKGLICAVCTRAPFQPAIGCLVLGVFHLSGWCSCDIVTLWIISAQELSFLFAAEHIFW